MGDPQPCECIDQADGSWIYLCDCDNRDKQALAAAWCAWHNERDRCELIVTSAGGPSNTHEEVQLRLAIVAAIREGEENG